MNDRLPARPAPLAAAITLALSQASFAASCPTTVTVDSKADNMVEDDVTTLREAVASVILHDVNCTKIDFDLPAGTKILLKSSLQMDNRNIVLQGPGPDKLVISPKTGFTEGDLVYIQQESGGDSVTISGITFDGDGDGDGKADVREDGAIYMSGSGHVVLNNLVVRRFDAANQGAVDIYDQMNVTLNNVRFYNNRNEGGHGGAISIYNNAESSYPTIKNSYFKNNRSFGDGGAIFYNGANGGTLRISGSTFDGNVALGTGGALMNNGGPVSIVNSTLSGNRAPGGGTSPYETGTGGAYFANFGTLELEHSTVVRNEALSGGGIYGYEATLSCEHSIISLNKADITPNYPEGYMANECLIGKTGDKLKLAPLANNGGLTPTHLPQAGSIAIDRGATELAVGMPAKDQRGKPRLQGDAVDIGSVETAP